jgi:RNA polymerase sigma-70 factor, ECF subfamily
MLCAAQSTPLFSDIDRGHVSAKFERNNSRFGITHRNYFQPYSLRKRMSESPSHPQGPNRVRPNTSGTGAPTTRVNTYASSTPANPQEADVLARAQAGDHQAFAQLYALHKRRIYSLCLRMVGNIAEAEDLTQEAFLQLHRKISTFRGDSAFSTWLHRLAINVVLMQLRKKGLSLISLDEAMEPTPEEGPSRSFGAPDLTLTGAIDRLALERAVGELPAGYRLIFILHDVEGFEHNEIASMLDCSIGNSKSQLHKARLKLRDALRAQGRPELLNQTRQEAQI